MKSLFLLLLLFLFAACHFEKNNPSIIDLSQVPQKTELFAEGTISTHLYERDIAISPDGNEIIFTLNDYQQIHRCLVSIRKTEEGWGEKEVMSFSGRYHDIEPFFSVDGEKLYFASNRPIYGDTARNDYNLWVSLRVKDGWGNPEPLPANINTPKDEFYPSLSRNNNLYFTATRDNGIGTEDIFLSRYSNGEYQNPEPLDTAINSATYEFNAYVSPDETILVFGSYGREDGMGGGDLYISRKDEKGNWTPARNMGAPVNSSGLDFCPFIDFSRGNFYFTSTRHQSISNQVQKVEDIEVFAEGVLNGMGNIYRIGWEQVDLD
ncbi:TolB family protein [Marinilabilia sp.]